VIWTTPFFAIRATGNYFPVAYSRTKMPPLFNTSL
jgi:hypothetical protein